MQKTNYLKKRDNKGLLVCYTGFKESKLFSEFCLESIKKNRIYKILIKYFDEKLIELYFKTYIYRNNCAAIHQLIDFTTENPKNKIVNNYAKIKINKANNLFYLKKYFRKKNIKVKFVKDLFYYSEIILSKLKYFKKIFLYFKNHFLINLNGATKMNQSIAVAYKEGINKNKRNDLYWYDEKFFLPSQILIYFEYDELKKKYEKEYDLGKKIKELKFNCVDIKNFLSNKEVKFIKEIKNEILQLIKLSDEEKSIRAQVLIFLKNVEFWFNFFSQFNVKIHTDSENANISKIEKEIALKKIGAFTFSSTRSYIGKKNFDFIGDYSSDIIFSNNIDNSERLVQSENIFNNCVVTGKQSKIFTRENIEELKKIKTAANNKKIILILDSNHTNKNIVTGGTYLPTDYFLSFYYTLLNILKKREDIFFIIKTKKEYLLSKEKKLLNYLKNLQSQNKCFIVKDPARKHPEIYSSISDFIFAASSSIPSALINCISLGNKGIFCDYANLSSIEKDLYKYKNELVVNDLSTLEKYLIEILNHRIISKKGDWSNMIKFTDPFMDDNGNLRCAKYLKNIFNKIKLNLPIKECIEFANNEYIKENGFDKILFKQ